MGGFIQKVFQTRGDKKRKNSGINSLQFLFPLIVPSLLLLAIFSLLTGFVKKYPSVFILYSSGLLSYLLVERLFLGKGYLSNIKKQDLSSPTAASQLKIYEIIAAFIIVVGTISSISSERWLHLLYLPLMIFISIRLRFNFNLFGLLLIGVVESPYLLSGENFEIVLMGTIFLCSIMAFLLTWDLKKKRRKAELELERIKDKADMYDIQSLEEEDLLASTLQHSMIHEEELSEIAHAIKESLYADGVHIFSASSDGNLALRFSTDAPVLYRAGIVQRVAEEGIPRLLTLDSKNLTPGYAVDYEINSLIAVPLKHGKAITGVLVIDSLRRHAFNERDLEIMERYGKIISSVFLKQLISFQRERSERLIRLLYEETAGLTTTIKQEELCSLIVRSCHRVFPSSVVSLILKKEEGFAIFKEGESSGESRISLQIKPKFEVPNPFYSLIAEEKKFLHLPELKNEDFAYLPFYAKNAKSLLAVPLCYEDELLGLIVIFSDRPGAFKQEQIEFLRVYANQAAIAFQNARLYKEIENLATTDGLTGLFNHRKFQEELERELKRHERSGKHLSLALCDIDFFNKINDTYGHPAGDAVLKAVAGIIRETVRSTDIAARYGGEEFAIILIETPLKEARLIAERLRKKVESHKFTYKGSTIRATISIGIASFQPGLKLQKGKLIEDADKALYYAKQAGRNQTILWDISGVPQKS